jgi:hypothetical protein
MVAAIVTLTVSLKRSRVLAAPPTSPVQLRGRSVRSSPPDPGASRGAGSPVPAAIFRARPGKSNTQTISRASVLPVLTTRRRVSTSLAGWAPFLAVHFYSPARASARAAGLTEASDAQPYRLALHRCTVGPQPLGYPGGYRPPSRHATLRFRRAHQLQRSHLTPACSGLAALAADARR